VTDVVIDFLSAKRRLRPKERLWGPPPIQKTLALADAFQRQLDAENVNQSGLAHLYGFTRARVTQVLSLLKLHPSILAFLRTQEAGPFAKLYTERRLRPLLHLPGEEQISVASSHVRGFEFDAGKIRRSVGGARQGHAALEGAETAEGR
jgi:hypothetical protein